MKFHHIVVAAAAFLLAFAVAASAQDASRTQAQGQAPAGDANKGQVLYRSIGCWECHGTEGQGGAATAPKVAATALPYAAFMQQLRTPQNQMPPYEPKVLSDADAANIYAFLKSIPPAQAAKDIPLLNTLN